MKLVEVNLPRDKIRADVSPKKRIIQGKKYEVVTKVVGKIGEEYSGYFGVVILDQNEREITRKIQWLNDFSGTKKQIKVIFAAPEDGVSARIIYRINNETPVNSDCSYSLLPIEKVIFSEIDSSRPENFETPSDFRLQRSKELSPEEEDIFEKNLVWIFASPRSGTSWLGTQLLSYKTLSVNEPQIGLHLGMREPQIRHKIVRRIDVFKKEPDYFFSQPYTDTWNFYLRKLILNRLYAQVQDLSKKIMIKEPNGAVGSDILSQCTPTSKIIFLIRDGRDVIDSVMDFLKKDSWAVKGYGFTPVLPHRRLLEIQYQAKLWVTVVEILTQTLNQHPKENRLLVKYEDLRKNTLKELKKIYQFIEVKIPEKELKSIVNRYSFEKIPSENKGEGKITRSATPGKWKENFNSKEKKEIDDIMASTLKKLGYQS